MLKPSINGTDEGTGPASHFKWGLGPVLSLLAGIKFWLLISASGTRFHGGSVAIDLLTSVSNQ